MVKRFLIFFIPVLVLFFSICSFQSADTEDNKEILQTDQFITEKDALAAETRATAQCSALIFYEPASITASSIQLLWERHSDSRYFRLDYKKASETQWRSVYPANNTYNLKNLIPNTSYSFRVRSYCLVSVSPLSQTVTYQTAAAGTVPVPGGLAVYGLASNQATLTWYLINGINSYDVRYKAVSSLSWTVITVNSTNILVVTGLSALTEYEYQVRSVSSGGSSNYSASLKFTTPENVNTPPQNFRSFNITPTTVNFSWTPVSGAAGYTVRYKITNSSEWIYTGFSSPDNALLTGLFPNRSYEAQIQTNIEQGATEFTGSIFFTTPQITSINPPANLKSSQISSTFATISWDPVPGALNYNVRRRVSGTSSWTFQHTLSETSLTTYGLTPSTNYEFQVMTHSEIGGSAYSASAFFTTQNAIVPDVPSSLTVRDITSVSAFLSWENVLYANSYIIQYRIQGVAFWTQVSILYSSYTLTGLTPSKTYEWQVKSIGEAAESVFSPIQGFTTLSTDTLPVPSGLFIMGLDINQAALIWGIVTGAISYDVRYKKTSVTGWTNVNVTGTNLYVATGLTGATGYEFQVRAVFSNGISLYSPSYYFTTR